jgi:hypothetical protein
MGLETGNSPCPIALSGFAVSVAFKAPSVGSWAAAAPRLLVDGVLGPIDNPDIKKFLITLRKSYDS